MSPAPELLTVAQAAARLGLQPSTVYDLCAGARPHLEHVRVGPGRGKILVPAPAVAAYLDRCRVPAGGHPKPEKPRRVRIIRPTTPGGDWRAEFAAITGGER
jgi:excisionase family DNA binding protein